MLLDLPSKAEAGGQAVTRTAESIVTLALAGALVLALVAPVWRDLRRAWKNHRPFGHN